MDGGLRTGSDGERLFPEVFNLKKAVETADERGWTRIFF
jgi:hypothetical protein